jgi:uncharacterized membrane protein YoaK (UPF0700 family)
MVDSNSTLSAYNPKNVIIWWILAFQAGAINVGGFMACHRFVTHTTGFATFFGVEAAEGQWIEALGMLTVPMFFLIGAMISAFFIDRPHSDGSKPHWNIVLFLIATIMAGIVALGTAGEFGVFGEPLTLARDYLLLTMLCLASGLQNAAITSASGAVVRTTHLTGITTDLGIGIVRVLTHSQVHQRREMEIRANWLRAGIIGGFVLGSFIGALLFLKVQYWGFLLPWLISFTLWIISSRMSQRGSKSLI